MRFISVLFISNYCEKHSHAYCTCVTLLNTHSATCGNRRPGTGASLFVPVQSPPDFSLSHLLEGIKTQVLKTFVRHRVSDNGAQRRTYTHGQWNEGGDTMHGHARGIYALVFRRLAAEEDAWKKDKLVLQPRTEWRGNQRDFDEACQSSKVTSVESHSMGLFINLGPCVCVYAFAWRGKREEGERNFNRVMAASNMSVSTDWSSCAVNVSIVGQ